MSTALLLAPPFAAAKAVVVDIEVGTSSDGSMYMRPGNVTVKLNDEVTFRIRNPDKIFHDVAILDYAGNDVEIEVAAGTTEEHKLTASQAGDFRMICEVRNHKQLGMQGTLHVEKEGVPIPGVLAVAALAGAALLVRRRG